MIIMDLSYIPLLLVFSLAPMGLIGGLLFELRNQLWRKKHAVVTMAEIINITPSDNMVNRRREYKLELRYMDENGDYRNENLTIHSPMPIETDMLSISVVRDEYYYKGLDIMPYEEYKLRCPRDMAEEEIKARYERLKESLIAYGRRSFGSSILYPQRYVKKIELADLSEIGDKKRLRVNYAMLVVYALSIFTLLWIGFEVTKLLGGFKE